MSAIWLSALVALLSALTLSAGPEGLFRDSFDSAPEANGWRVDASAGNSVRVMGGSLRIRGRLNTFAHIERPAPGDRIRVSALMETSVPAGISWSAGVFLYWSPGVWCQLSVIDFQDGQYFVAEALGGRPRDVYLEQCDRHRPHWLRIELGSDCVRYLTRSVEDDEWTRQRTIRRPRQFAGRPALVILGKGYGQKEGEHGNPDLDNDYGDPGPVIEVGFDDVRIERTPRSRLQLRTGELEPKGDIVGERILGEPGDPTYEKVSCIYPPMRHPREAMGIKWHPEEVGVTETGAIELGRGRISGEVQTITGSFQGTRGRSRAAIMEGPPKRQLLDGHLPVVITTWSEGDLAYEQAVLAHNEGLSDSAPIHALARLAVRNRGAAAAELSLEFAIAPEAARGEDARTMLQVPPGDEGCWCIKAPCPYAPGSTVEQLSEEAFEAAVAQTRQFWRAEYATGMQISVPDDMLMDAFRAWLTYNAINVDKVGDYYEPHDGAGFYEQVYGYSAARYAWVLDLYGRHEEAEAVLATLRDHQADDGLLDWNFGLTDTGVLLMAMAVHYETTGDAAWLRAAAPSARKACEWIVRHRAESRGEGRLVRGLIKHRSYCDYPPPVYSYLHNCYCCAGMARIGEALVNMGMTEVGASIVDEAEAYRADILSSMQAASIRVEGRRVIPMEPDTQRLLRASAYDSRDYYGLVASTLLECDVPAADSRQAEAIASFLRDCGGIMLGVSEFRRGIDHAYSYGYMRHQLIHGNVERYLLGLYTSLAYGMTRGTFSSVECTQLKTGENALTLPHLYSGTQQLFMLRTMLVREEGDRLILCSGVPRAWLAEGKKIEVSEAATRFGNVGFRIKSDVDDGYIVARIDTPDRRRPGQIILHLRHPDARPIAHVTINGKRSSAFTESTVRFDDPAGVCRAVVGFGG